MSAQRKLIRLALAQHLKRSYLVAAANVFPSRSEPLSKDYELPAMCVYGTRETITLWQESPRQYKRELDLRVEIIVEGTGADDQLDDIGHEVEQLIGRSNRLQYERENTVSEILLTGDVLDFRQEGEKIIGSLVKTYTATYFTYEPDELDSEPVDDLNTINTDYSLSNAQSVPERASDLVELIDD